MTGKLQKGMVCSSACFLLVCVVLMPIYYTFAGFERICSSITRDHPNGLCGNALAETLMRTCEGGFNTPSYIKRDIQNGNVLIVNK